MEIPYAVKPRPDTGLYNAKVGIWLFLASEVMLFGALFSSYILLRVNAEPGTWPHHWLNVPLGTVNTIVLIASSITVVLAWASLKMNQFGRYKFFQAITLLCACAFVCIKSFEYRDKFNHYEFVLKSGKIVDGHIDRAKSTVKVPFWTPFKIVDESGKGIVAVEGHEVEDHAELMDGGAHHEHKPIEDSGQRNQRFQQLRSVAQHLHRHLFRPHRPACLPRRRWRVRHLHDLGPAVRRLEKRSRTLHQPGGSFRASSGTWSIWFGSSCSLSFTFVIKFMSESHDHEHSVEEIQKHVRRYLLIGVALAIGTVLTVWASYIDFGKIFGHPGAVSYNVTVALIIASAKGFLVAGFFMHLLSEKKMIYSV